MLIKDGDIMPFSLNGTEILIKFQQKHNELNALQNILKSASALSLLSEQQAPSAHLQKQNEVYFGDLMAILAQCQLLYHALDEVLQQAKYNKEISEKMLKDIINLSGDLKDAKQFALQKIVVFENSVVYQNLRDSIGANNMTQILTIMNGADNLLSDLSKVDFAKYYVSLKLNEIEMQQLKRKYKQAKNELINFERKFQVNMATIVNLNKSFNLYQILIKQHYPNLALFIVLSDKLRANAEKLHAIFELAEHEPSILINEQTQKLYTSCYQTLQEASILKSKIDKYEQERFNSDSEPSMVFLKKGFQAVDARGLYSYICMPFQRLCRYPLLLKEVVSCLSKQEKIVTRTGGADDSLSQDILSFQSFLELSLTLTQESNELQRQLEGSLTHRKPWVYYSVPLNSRLEPLICGRRSMPAKADDSTPSLPSRGIFSSKKSWTPVESMDSERKVEEDKPGYSKRTHASRPLPVPPHRIQSAEILSVRSRLKKPK